MTSPYEKCPYYESDDYLLRPVCVSDAPDLLLVYSDEKAVPYFNSDNCGGDDFHYTSLERMQEAIRYWQWEYGRKGFVRWAILDRKIRQVIGTIELFNRQSDDYFHNCGLLRLDLRSDYEREECMVDILSLIVHPAFELFACQMIAAKAPPFATERQAALGRIGFKATEEILVGGHDKKQYHDYWVLLNDDESLAAY